MQPPYCYHRFYNFFLVFPFLSGSSNQQICLLRHRSPTKIAVLKKGLFFCHGQVKKAILSFQKVLRQNAEDDGDEVVDGEDSDSESVVDDAENDTESIVDGGVEDINSTVDGSEVEEDEDNDGSASLNNEIVAPMRSNISFWNFLTV